MTKQYLYFLIFLASVTLLTSSAAGQSRDEYCPKVAKELARAKGETSPEKRAKELDKVLSYVNGNTWSILNCSNGFRAEILDALGRTDEAYTIAKKEAASPNPFRNDSEIVAEYNALTMVAIHAAKSFLGRNDLAAADYALTYVAKVLSQDGTPERRAVNEAFGEYYLARASNDPSLYNYYTGKAVAAYKDAGKTEKATALADQRASKITNDMNAVKDDGTPDLERRERAYFTTRSDLTGAKKFDEALSIQSRWIDDFIREPKTYLLVKDRAWIYMKIAERDNSAAAARSCIEDVKRARAFADYKQDLESIYASTCYLQLGEYQNAYDEVVRLRGLAADWYKQQWRIAMIMEPYNAVVAKAASISRNPQFEDEVQKAKGMFADDLLAQARQLKGSSAGHWDMVDSFINLFDKAQSVLAADSNSAMAKETIRLTYDKFGATPGYTTDEKFRRFLVAWRDNGVELTRLLESIPRDANWAETALRNLRDSSTEAERRTSAQAMHTACTSYWGNVQSLERYDRTLSGLAIPPSFRGSLGSIRDITTKHRSAAITCINSANRILGYPLIPN
ncbi:MAG: hypothetical protein K1X36_09230 [Pyrinomonadaceae bacterium]|nr:hypothetical protein [Pyrinomonadaceae bacterium]